MKRIFSVSILLIMLAGMMLSMNSCLRPDLGDCPRQNVRIVVKTYPEATRTTDSGRYDIENVTIYVFDKYNKFVTAWEGTAYVYGQVYEAWLDLAPDDYHFVIWTNQGETYSATHTVPDCHNQQPLLEDLTLYMNCPADRTITDNLQDFHHGMLSGATVLDNTTNEFTVILTPNTYKINVTVKGLPVNTNRYGFTITDNNSHYTFENKIVNGQSNFKHYRFTGFDNDKELKTSMTVLKLTDRRSPYFDFSDETNSRSIFADDLVDMIKRAYSKKSPSTNFSELFETVFEYDIVLRYDALLGMTVSVNGWEYNENETEL